ncbi:MAG: DUF1850 domain-containing protein [Desulfobacteraceae bacterium]|jgi:hypothetical protein
MKPTRTKILAASAGLLLAGLLLGLRLPGGVVLSVTPVKEGPPLAQLWLAPGETFTIRYYHSVENAPIWETHSVDAQGRIYIEEERYLKFGAGMGKMPGVGRMVRRGPYEVIEAMHMPTGNFVLRIGSAGVDHTLIYRGREINLSAVAPHVAVRFSARPVDWLHRLRLNLCTGGCAL